MRPLVFLLAPLLSFGVFYLFGWMAIVGMMLLALAAVAFSSQQAPNPTAQTDDPTLSSYGISAKRVADI